MVTTFKEPEEHTCQHCGYVGVDLHTETGYVGGHWYAQDWYCDDRKACWQRGEAQNKKVKDD